MIKNSHYLSDITIAYREGMRRGLPKWLRPIPSVEEQFKHLIGNFPIRSWVRTSERIIRSPFKRIPPDAVVVERGPNAVAE